MRVKPRNQSVQLISKGEPWSSDHPDPSRSLSPRTLDRLRELLRRPPRQRTSSLPRTPRFETSRKVNAGGLFGIKTAFPFASLTRPILANGFESGLGPVADHFEHDENGLPVFSEKADESRLLGLFYSGPSLVHRNSLFCFIYKFRARFGVIAHEVATRLGKPDVDEKLMPYLKAGFMNEDLDCCTECQCAIEPAESAPEPSAFAS
jgi:putative flavoprotein involved in K+ transport